MKRRDRERDYSREGGEEGLLEGSLWIPFSIFLDIEGGRLWVPLCLLVKPLMVVFCNRDREVVRVLLLLLYLLHHQPPPSTSLSPSSLFFFLLQNLEIYLLKIY
jgi:hypothetical protein